jgi:hypothetical protein
LIIDLTSATMPTARRQFVLGEPLNRRNRPHKLRLWTVSELFPEVIHADLDGDGLPSCGAAEALNRQEPFVNPTLANHALALLACSNTFSLAVTFCPANGRSRSFCPLDGVVPEF